MLDILTNDLVKQTYMLPDFGCRKDAIPLFNRLITLSLDSAHYVRGIYCDDTLIGFLNDVEIKDGSIVMRLIKPIQVDLSYLFYELGNKSLVMSTVFFPVIIGVEIYKYSVAGHIAFDIGKFLLFMLSIILSYLLAFYLNLVFGYMAFFLMNLWGLNILKAQLSNSSQVQLSHWHFSLR